VARLVLVLREDHRFLLLQEVLKALMDLVDHLVLLIPQDQMVLAVPCFLQVLVDQVVPAETPAVPYHLEALQVQRVPAVLVVLMVLPARRDQQVQRILNRLADQLVPGVQVVQVALLVPEDLKDHFLLEDQLDQSVHCHPVVLLVLLVLGDQDLLKVLKVLHHLLVLVNHSHHCCQKVRVAPEDLVDLVILDCLLILAVQLVRYHRMLRWDLVVLMVQEDQRVLMDQAVRDLQDFHLVLLHHLIQVVPEVQ